MSSLSIVMYHYVRDNKKSYFSNLNTLDIQEFKNQIYYLNKNYQIISYDEFVYATLNKKKLPKDSCMLTFDDGYKDHVNYVLPELAKNKISGFFFPVGSTVMENTVLDINIIHAIQAQSVSDQSLYTDLNNLLLKNGYSDKDIQNLVKKFLYKGRYDSKYVRYFKEVIQNLKRDKLKNKILKILFKKYIEIDFESFSKSLYLSKMDIKELKKNGMYIGGHGYTHQRLEYLNQSMQIREINKTINFLNSINSPKDNWIMCYPFGSYNSTTIKLLKKKKCIAGMTVKVGKNKINNLNLYELKRFDTNDFKK